MTIDYLNSALNYVISVLKSANLQYFDNLIYLVSFAHSAAAEKHFFYSGELATDAQI